MKKSTLIVALILLNTACVHKLTPATIRMDHSYQQTSGPEVYSGFETQGFIPNPLSVNHPGQKTCQFLHFRDPDGFEPYLEFCYINLNNPKDGYDVSKDPTDIYPGFAWCADQNLEMLQMAKKDEWAAFGPKFSHKNYDWQKDSTTRLPGWNAVSFDPQPIRDIFIWMNEYEKSPDRPLGKRSAAGLVEHPNSARSIRGFLWGSISESEKQSLQRLTGGHFEGNRLIPQKGPWIQFLNADDPMASYFQTKTTRYWAVVLNVDSLSTFIERTKSEQFVGFAGQKVARIALGASSWDILAVSN